MKNKKKFTISKEQFEKKINLKLKDIVWIDEYKACGNLLLNYSEDDFVSINCNTNHHHHIDYIFTESTYKEIFKIIQNNFIECSDYNRFQEHFFINPDKMRYIFYNNFANSVLCYQAGYENNSFNNNKRIRNFYKYFYNKNDMFIYFNDYNDFEFKIDHRTNHLDIYSVVEDKYIGVAFEWEEEKIKDFKRYIETIKIKEKIINF